MFLRGKVDKLSEKIDRLLALQEANKTVIDLLLEQNRELLDRLMARNFRELKLFAPQNSSEVQFAPSTGYVNLESLAGQEIDDETYSEQIS